MSKRVRYTEIYPNRLFTKVVDSCLTCPNYMFTPSTQNHWCTGAKPCRMIAGYDAAVHDLPDHIPDWCPLPKTDKAP